MKTWYGNRSQVPTVGRQRYESIKQELAAVALTVVAGLFISAVGIKMAGPWFPLAFAFLAFAAIAIFVRPILGVYLTVLLALIGDGPTASWYPFALNFSSRESILYLHDALTISPLDVYLAVTLIAWLAQVAGSRSWHSEGGDLKWPMVVFIGCLVVGVLWGIGVRGGDRTIGVWELRPLVYLPMIFFLVSNLFTRTKHYIYLAAVAVLAITIQNVQAIMFVLRLDGEEPGEGLTEHAASMHYAWLFLLLMAVWTFRGSSFRFRIAMLVVAIPTVVTFVLSQRRAAVVGLGVGVLTYLVVLLFRQRKTFFVLAPTILVLTLGYTLAFWNSSSGVGFGARAIKTVFAEDELSSRDTSSNIYRLVENFNLVTTIQNNRLLGVGFGQPFEQPARLPDISFFVFYEYIPHNSILWIWLKIGIVGFTTLLVMIALALRRGVQATLLLPDGDVAAVMMSALGYVVMFLVFAYVDIAWDPRSTLFLGSCMAACVNVLRLHHVESSNNVAELDDPDSEVDEEDGPSDTGMTRFVVGDRSTWVVH